jgi:chromate reductase
MKNLIAFGASNSRKSVNQQLAKYTASQVGEANVNLLDLNDFEMPIYSMDREQETGIPELAKQLVEAIGNSDGVVISFAEHNGSFTAAFKNILDWASRLEGSIFQNKQVFVLATSPGPRGGLGAFEQAKMSLPYQGAKVVAGFSLPSFYQNFNQVTGIQDTDLKKDFTDQLELFNQAINAEQTEVTKAV